MKNILIEGTNATGKTTTLNVIRRLYPESTFIEFHDFYHEHVINQFQLNELFLENHWTALTLNQKREIDNYLRRRNDTIFLFIKNQIFNRTIVERLLLTHAVYSKLLLDNDISDYLLSKEEELDSSNTMLILVTCENKVLKNILEENIRIKEGRNLPSTQFHLKSIEIGLKKNDLYNEYFHKLNCKNKLIIKNNGTTIDDLTNEVIRILSNASI